MIKDHLHKNPVYSHRIRNYKRGFVLILFSSWVDMHGSVKLILFTFSLDFMLQETFFSTSGDSLEYFRDMSRNEMDPFPGQPVGGFVSGVSKGASGFNLVYSMTLSTDVICAKEGEKVLFLKILVCSVNQFKGTECIYFVKSLAIILWGRGGGEGLKTNEIYLK